MQTLTPIEHKRDMLIIIFLTEKRDGGVKVSTCANGNTQRDYIPKKMHRVYTYYRNN